jgi:hypothetical protein
MILPDPGHDRSEASSSLQIVNSKPRVPKMHRILQGNQLDLSISSQKKLIASACPASGRWPGARKPCWFLNPKRELTQIYSLNVCSKHFFFQPTHRTFNFSPGLQLEVAARVTVCQSRCSDTRRTVTLAPAAVAANSEFKSLLLAWTGPISSWT